MRSLIALVIVGLGTSGVAAQALSLPGFLYGTWETDPANCQRPEPTAGYSLSITKGEPDQIEFVNWETEGGGCDVVMVEGELPHLKIIANCSAEEEERTASTFLLDTGADGYSMSYRPSEDAAPMNFTRCD